MIHTSVVKSVSRVSSRVTSFSLVNGVSTVLSARSTVVVSGTGLSEFIIIKA